MKPLAFSLSPFAFKGFSGGKTRQIPLPAAFFAEILPYIQSISELKIILFTFWSLDHQEGDVKFLHYRDFAGDETLLAGLGETAAEAQATLEEGLRLAVEHGVLLQSEGEERLYFLNSPRGRAALKVYQQGEWSPESEPHLPVTLASERPNIFRLYEENMGPLTPLISEALQEAEKTYASEWIEDAMRIAVKKNVRNWRYVEAILKSWQEKGRDDTNRRDSEKDRRRYIEGEYADFIEH
jgi:DNA replication protein